MKYRTAGLAFLRAVAPPGACPFCWCELPGVWPYERKRVHCGRVACARAYMCAWRRDQRTKARFGIVQTPDTVVSLDDRGQVRAIVKGNP